MIINVELVNSSFKRNQFSILNMKFEPCLNVVKSFKDNHEIRHKDGSSWTRVYSDSFQIDQYANRYTLNVNKTHLSAYFTQQIWNLYQNTSKLADFSIPNGCFMDVATECLITSAV